MEYEIIDFHTHPYRYAKDCISVHNDAIPRSIDETPRIMQKNGVSKFCGSVLSHDVEKNQENVWSVLKSFNDDALFLKDYYKGSYIAGFHVHPNFLEESIKEIDRFHANGVNLIGELVPWQFYYDSYCSDNMNEILDYATQKGMILSIHPTSDDDMDLLCKNHPNLTIVGAHPIENQRFERHIDRANKFKNYYLDLSGGGIYRYGATRRLINEMGADRILFGSDYAICNLQMYVDGVRNDSLLTNDEKRLILADNAKRILNLI